MLPPPHCSTLLGYGIDRQAIVKTALLGLPQPLWSFVPPGAKDPLDFSEQFPYNPDKAKALLREVGFDEKTPLRYTTTTHATEPALPTIATIMKTQLAKIGVEVTEVCHRSIESDRRKQDAATGQGVGPACT
jgi:peptide/nickel transport system substrate-binding protein